MHDFRSKIVKSLSVGSGLPEREVDQLLEQPKEEGHGDFSFPCFSLSKKWKKSPAAIASEIALKLPPDASLTFQVVGAYINANINETEMVHAVLEQIRANKVSYGKPAHTKKETVMIEFCQANTHKPFHIGHFRNLCLGDALVRLWRFSGHEVFAANYPGDVGAHVAKCLWGLRKFHAHEAAPAQHRGEWLGAIYAEANAKSEEDAQAKAEISIILQKLESGDPELTKLWNETRQWCLDELNEIYSGMDVSFDIFFFESEVEKPGKLLVQQMLRDGLAKMDDGALVVDIEEHKLGVFVVLKSDGTSLYSTKDIALAKQKFEQFNVERSIYVVGSEQRFYFQQLFKTLEVMGFKHAKDCFHLSYELVMLPEGKMSSREGNIVTFRSVYEESVAKALEEVSKRHDDWGDEKKQYTARCIAKAAMKFAMLNQDNNKTIIFDIRKSVDFEGETGPYLQYAIARINSVIRKHNSALPPHAEASALIAPQEIRLVKHLGRFPSVIETATREYKPMKLSKYLVDIAQLYNDFYQNCPILSAEEQRTKMARLVLCEDTKLVLSIGLSLLGIPVVEEM